MKATIERTTTEKIEALMCDHCGQYLCEFDLYFHALHENVPTAEDLSKTVTLKVFDSKEGKVFCNLVCVQLWAFDQTAGPIVKD